MIIVKSTITNQHEPLELGKTETAKIRVCEPKYYPVS